MRIQRQYTITVPIPQFLPPYVVVAHLQTISPVIRHLGTLSRYDQANERVPEVRNDQFFLADADIAGFQIYELITLAPGLTKEVTYPAFFQPSANGVRCRANGAAGITGWVELTVRPRKVDAAIGSPEGTVSTPSTTTSDSEEYEVHETLLVEANSLLMPFVARTMEESHRHLCRNIIEEAAAGFMQGHETTSTTTTTPQDKMQE